MFNFFIAIIAFLVGVNLTVWWMNHFVVKPLYKGRIIVEELLDRATEQLEAITKRVSGKTLIHDES